MKQRQLSEVQTQTEKRQAWVERQLRARKRLSGLALVLALCSGLALSYVLFITTQQPGLRVVQMTAEAQIAQLATEVAVRSTAEAQALARKAAVLAQVNELATEVAALSTAETSAPEQEIVTLADPDSQTTEAAIRSTAEALARVEATRLEQQNKVLLSRQLAAQAFTHLDEQLDLSLLLSLEANRITNSVETRSSLLAGLAHYPQLISFLPGYSGPVWSLAFSPDGQYVASGEADGLIILWDVNGQPQKQLHTDYEGMVVSLAFSPDGQTLAAGGDDGTIMVWGVTQGRFLSKLPANSLGRVSSLAFSPDGQTLAVGGCQEIIDKVSCKQGGIHLWDISVGLNPSVASQQPFETPLTGHNGRVSSLTFSSDGQTLASGSTGGTILLWDIPSMQPRSETLTGHNGAVLGLAFNPDSRTLASFGSDDSIAVWNVAGSQPQILVKNQLTGYKTRPVSVAFSLALPANFENQTLASGYHDGKIILWNIAAIQPGGPVKSHLTGHNGPIRNITFSPDGQTLASGGEDKSIILWDVSSMLDAGIASDEPIGAPLTGHNGRVSSLAFSPDGRTVASGSCHSVKDDIYCEQGEILLWDVSTILNTSVSAILNTGVSSGVNSSVSPGVNSSVTEQSLISKPLTGHHGAVLSLAFSPDGRTLASGGCGQLGDDIYCEQGEIMLWDVSATLNTGVSSPLTPTITSSEPIGKSLVGHGGAVSSLVFNPDGQTLASGGPDEAIILWDVESGQPKDYLFAVHNNRVLSLAFSPDGRTLASGALDGSITLWDVAHGQPRGQPFIGHEGAVWSVAFSPDGQILASGGEDKSVILWDVSSILNPGVASGQRLGEPLTGDNRQLWSVAFSPNGQFLAAGSTGGTIILWDLNIESWRAQACRRANRNLTRLEWDQFIGSETPYHVTCPNLPVGN